MMVLISGRKGDKFAKSWLGPYKIEDSLGKNMYRLSNPESGLLLKKTFNGSRYTSPTFY